ncbi:hypothetical protein [Snuella lapsa]
MTFACDNNHDSVQSEINGEYVGTFERDGNTSNVTLDFNNGIYSGESEVVKFPAICNGNYSISNNSIQFQNECIWTAEFDWTLILSDEWRYGLSGNTLILSKTNGGKYTLTKQ